MCLATKYIERFGKRTGYKIVRSSRGRVFRTGLVAQGERVMLPLGQWVCDPNTGEIQGCNGCSRYPAGFHILTDRRQANRLLRQEKTKDADMVLVKVRLRKQVAYGRVHWVYWDFKADKGTDTVVAREVMNLGEVK